MRITNKIVCLFSVSTCFYYYIAAEMSCVLSTNLQNLQCLTLGEDKYMLRKCDASVFLDGTKITFVCKGNRKLKGVLQYHCNDGQWEPPELPICEDVCPELIYNPLKTKVTCNGEACNGEQPIGTVAKIECMPTYEKPYTFAYNTTSCSQSGWSDMMYDCIKTITGSTDYLYLSSGGEETPIEKVPYHVAIFLESGDKYVNICGGSIISRRAIISAAHCFYKVDKPHSIDKFKIVAGKYHRNYEIQDEHSQEANIAKIFVHDSFKKDQIIRDDLALIILDREFNFTKYVQKILVDQKNEILFDEGIVSGWGRDENNTVLDKLHSVKLEEKPCIDAKSVTEKFCAGGDGNTTCKGDSGGGFVIQKDKIKYLVGVVSTSSRIGQTVCDPNEPAKFNKFAPYGSVFSNADKYLQLYYACEDYRFKCKSAKCISIENLCDGKPDCEENEDESLDTCSFLASQKMLQKGIEVLRFSKYYEPSYSNWVVPIGALWVALNFLSNSVKNVTIQNRIQLDFGISKLNHKNEIIKNIKNVSLSETEFYFTNRRMQVDRITSSGDRIKNQQPAGNINLQNQNLLNEFFENVQQKPRKPGFFYLHDVSRVGIYMDADMKQQFNVLSTIHDFTTLTNEVHHIPMICLSDSPTQNSFHKYLEELNADVAVVSFSSTSIATKLYAIVPKGDFDITLKALYTMNIHALFNKVKDSSENICIPEFKVYTTMDYTPLLYRLGYSYLFSTDPIDLSVTDRPVQLQMDMRGLLEIRGQQIGEVFDSNKEFRVNRPFIFIITEDSTNSILQIGKILEPNHYTPYTDNSLKCRIFSETKCRD